MNSKIDRLGKNKFQNDKFKTIVKNHLYNLVKD